MDIYSRIVSDRNLFSFRNGSRMLINTGNSDPSITDQKLWAALTSSSSVSSISGNSFSTGVASSIAPLASGRSFIFSAVQA